MNRLQVLVSILGGAFIVLAGALSVNDVLFDQQSQSLAAEASAIFGPLKNAREQTMRSTTQPKITTRQSVGFVLPLQAGWNIIGTAGADVALSNLAGCDFQTPAFSYNGAEYEKTDRLALGHGYWVYASAPCRLQFPPTSQPETSLQPREIQPMPMMNRAEELNPVNQ